MMPQIHTALSYTQHECGNFTETFLALGIIINMHILSIYFIEGALGEMKMDHSVSDE